MHKSKFFTGQPIFSQLLSYISRSRVNQLASEHQTDHYYKRFKTYEHLVTMLYGIFNRCTSLREVSTGLQVWEHRINHLGILCHPRKSTLSDANTNRDAAVFEAIYMDLYFRYRGFLPDSRSSKHASRLYIADSTTISLFHEILQNSGRKPLSGRRKGGIKVHTLIRSDEDVPSLIRFTAARASDMEFLKHIHLPEGAILVIDRGFYSYKQWNRFDEEKVTWVTRFKEGSIYKIVKKQKITEVQKAKGVQKDYWVELGDTKNKKTARVKARLIAFRDKESKNTFWFLTNNARFSPATIAGFYRKRWQIESLFKRIKQNYPLRNFLGESENAIKIQIWCALIADLILKLVKVNAARNWSFSGLASMIRLHMMTYIELFSFLENPEKALRRENKQSYQISLFPT